MKRNFRAFAFSTESYATCIIASAGDPRRGDSQGEATGHGRCGNRWQDPGSNDHGENDSALGDPSNVGIAQNGLSHGGQECIKNQEMELRQTGPPLSSRITGSVDFPIPILGNKK